MFNVKQFFPGYSVCLFHKISCSHSLLNGYYISEQHLQPWIAYLQCIWQIFLFKAYCNFKGAPAAIHVSGTVIIQDAMCINLAFSRVLSFFEISTWNSSPVAAIHSMNGPFSIIKEQFQPHILSNLLYFFRTGGVAPKTHHSYQLWYLHGRHVLSGP